MPTHRALHRLVGCDVVARRVDAKTVRLSDDLAGDGIDPGQRLDLVAEHLDPQERFLVGRVDLERVAAHAERPRVRLASLRW